MGFFTDHPHTAVTDRINNAVGSENTTLEVELADILQIIKQGNSYENQKEAARAIRKKLKYGDMMQQSRALDLLNLFVSQLIRLPDLYNDFKLNNVLSSMTRGEGMYQPRIRKICIAYQLAWYEYLKEHPEAKGFNELFLTTKETFKFQKNVSKKARSEGKRVKRSRQNFLEDKADNSAVTADERYGIPRINMEKEAPKIKLLISDSLATAISLENLIMALPKGTYSTDNEECTAKFIQARAMRRKVLRYLQLITEGEFLGSLIRANEDLVEALTKYDQLADEVADYESDEENYGSDDEQEPSDSSYEQADEASLQSDNPFGDQNMIKD